VTKITAASASTLTTSSFRCDSCYNKFHRSNHCSVRTQYVCAIHVVNQSLFFFSSPDEVIDCCAVLFERLLKLSRWTSSLDNVCHVLVNFAEESTKLETLRESSTSKLLRSFEQWMKTVSAFERLPMFTRSSRICTGVTRSRQHFQSNSIFETLQVF
jgi:hypothetical protein